MRKLFSFIHHKPALVIAAISFIISIPFIQCLGDDTFIYMRPIQNFLESGQFEYNKGEPCYCMTSITWFLAWAGSTALFKNIDIARYFISILSHFFAFGILFLLIRKYIQNRAIWIIVLSVIYFDPFYVRWLWGGWELSFKIAMAALCIYALTEIHEKSTIRQIVLCGVCMALGILTRPELIFLGLIGLIYLILKFPGKIKYAVYYFLGCLLVLLPWFLYAHHVFGWILPHTVFAKTGKDMSLFDAQYFIPHGIKLVKILLLPQFILYALLIFVLLKDKLSKSNKTKSVPYFRNIQKEQWLDYLLITVWAVTVFGYYITGTYIASIRTGLFTPFIAIALGILIDHLILSSNFKWLDLKKTILLVCMIGLVSMTLQLKLYYRFSIFNPRYRMGADERFIHFARKIKELIKETDTIGLHELGIIGYFSERYIYDIAGLGTPDIVHFKLKEDQNPVGRYFRDLGKYPDYMVWQYGRGYETGKDKEIQQFFGQKYVPVYSEKVQRIGGINSPDYYDLYVLFRHDGEY